MSLVYHKNSVNSESLHFCHFTGDGLSNGQFTYHYIVFLRYYPGTWYPGTWYQVSVDTVLVLHNRLYIVLVVPLLQSQTLNLIVINVVTIKFSVFVAFSPLIPVYESFASGCREMFEHK